MHPKHPSVIPPEAQVKHVEAVPRPDPGRWPRLMLVKLIGLFMLDVVSDVNGIVQFLGRPSQFNLNLFFCDFC